MQITHASTVWKMDGLGSKFNLFKNCIYLGDICVPYKEFFYFLYFNCNFFGLP
jgi:hypothetical protein